MLLPVLTPLEGDLYLLRDRRRILALAPVLQELARRTGQLGAMHWLEYFLEAPSLAKKPPYLILQLCAVPSSGALHPQHVQAAALFFEYQICGLRTRILCTDDAVGFRTVIAPREDRARFAERAASALLRNGAHLVLATYEEPQPTASLPGLMAGARLGFRQRRVGRMLTLAPTYEETLAQLGRLTRRNLRYYRRQLASRMQLEFVGDARNCLTCAEFERLNDASLNPVRSREELRLRWRSSSESDGGFICGLRTAEGKWLSLIGGWRQETTTVVHWQLNVAGLEQESVGIVVRSFFLEHEIAQGARKLLMFGGTPHSIRFAFEEDPIADLVLCRPSLRAGAVRVLARELIRRSARARVNHLLQTLAEVPLSRDVVLVPERQSAISSASPQTSHIG